jgi:hypothetical protein
MKIEANRPLGSAAIRKDAKTNKSSEFAEALSVNPEEGEAAPSAVGGAGGIASIEALFALQEVPDATAGRKRALKRGNQMLDRLEDLKRGLLLGTIGRDKLEDLARLAREGSVGVDDPNLREVLQEIELRAEVELAKLSS